MEPNTSKNLATKVVAIGLISIFANAGLAAGCKVMDNKTKEDKAETRIVEVTNEEAGEQLALTGGWQAAENTAVSESQKALFEKATEKLLGVKYEPVAYLASQTVSGKNHCFLAKATVVRPGAVPRYTLVYIYEDLQNNLEILKIEDMVISAEK
ncbi:MAG: hypothetical protein IKT20_00390 [Clostridiales bacterium]|nr:hypothetical protein [Clostridiales bacterium]MBR6487346.1 hypothetical protein [Clostridiales bacterium]